MNILPIMPRFQNDSAKRVPLNNHPVIQSKMVPSLACDTVSFGNANRISDFMSRSVEEKLSRLDRISTTYLDVLESVANRLKDDGVSFDRAYCELHPIKSAESYLSKIVRSGSMKVSDAVRATLYIKNPYDLSIINDKLLPEMHKKGYVLAKVDTKLESLQKRGFPLTMEDKINTAKVFRVPDLDIRLENAAEKRHLLSNDLQYSIGQPPKSGYEDIQMRFVREFDKKRNPLEHELIILFGPNYAKAKLIESEKVYKNIREFDELKIRPEESPEEPDKLKAARYIDLLKQMFRGKISEKLFLNAKNKDLYDIPEEIPINFSETDIKMFENYFAGLNKKLTDIYKNEKAAAKASATATKQINSDSRHDKTLLNKIHENLRGTIEYFNHLHDLKKSAD